jgi:hypothetical protein
MKHKKGDKPQTILEEAREQFDLASDHEDDQRKQMLDDLRFARLSEQWPLNVKSQREAEGRPCLTINRLPAVIRQVVNDLRQNKPAIIAHPVDDGADIETAEVINGLIRNIEYTSDADVAYDTAVDNAVTMGVGYFRISIDYAYDDSFDLDIKIDAIPNVFSVYGDFNSEKHDSSDWNKAFITRYIPKEEFERTYKNNDPVDWDGIGYNKLPAPWMEGEQVLVCEYWKREEVARDIVQLSDGSIMDRDRFESAAEAFALAGISIVKSRTTKSHKVTQYILTGKEILETNPWPGRFIPIVPVYGDEVNEEGKRHFKGIVRDAKDPQRMFNYWRTTSTELVALAPKAPFIGAKGSFTTDADKWATANTSSHAYLEYDPVPGGAPPQRQPFSGVPAGALQEALNASDDIKAITGLYDASLGARSNETSGKAILMRQREGDVSTFHFADNLNRAIRHAGRILLDLIPIVYDAPRVVRVMGLDGESKPVPINQPVTPEQQLRNQQQGTEEANNIIRAYTLNAGKYDLVIESGPSYTTKREEAASQMLEMIRAYPSSAPIIGDLLAKNLDWPGAEEISQRLKAMLPPQVQGQNPQLQQLQQQLQVMQTESAALKNEVNTKQRELDIKAFEAETKRIQAVQAGMTPEQIQAMVMQTVQYALNSPDVLQLQQQQPNFQPQQPIGM